MKTFFSFLLTCATACAGLLDRPAPNLAVSNAYNGTFGGVAGAASNLNLTLSSNGIFASAPTVTTVAEPFTATPYWVQETSTFSGWGMYAGTNVPMFNRVQFYVRPWSAAYPITRMRCRVIASTYAGQVFGDVTTNVTTSAGVAALVTINFPTNITTTGALWLEWFANGRSGYLDATGGADYSAYPSRYATAASVASTTSTATSGSRIQWVKFSMVALGGDLTLTEQFNAKLMTDTILARMIVPTLGFTASATLGDWDAPQMTSQSSTFSGWGSSIFNPGQFSALQINVRAWTNAYPITQLRVRVMPEYYTNAVWADRTVDCVTYPGQITPVLVNFGTNVNAAGSNLWLEFYANGRTGYPINGTNSGPTTYNSRYATGGSVTSTTMANAATHYPLALRFGNVGPAVGSYDLTSEFAAKVGTTTSDPQTYTVLLPSTIYGVVSNEANVYFDNVIRSTVPTRNLLMDVVCSVGQQLENGWRLVSTNISNGTNAWALNIYNGDRLVSSAAANLVVARMDTGSNVTRKVLMIGDSTLAGSTITGELTNKFDADVMNIDLLGTKGYGIGSGNAHEGISGWTWAQFWTNSAASPFWTNGTSFSFSSYLSSNGFTMSSNDWVLVQLGINDVFGAATDANLQDRINLALSTAALMITNIQAAVPGIRIGIGLPIPPNASQDAFGIDYGSGQTRWRYLRNRAELITQMNAALGSRGDQVWLVPIHANLDAVNGFQFNWRPPSTRGTNNVALPMANSGVHPWVVTGYLQIADAWYAFLKCQEP